MVSIFVEPARPIEPASDEELLVLPVGPRAKRMGRGVQVEHRGIVTRRSRRSGHSGRSAAADGVSPAGVRRRPAESGARRTLVTSRLKLRPPRNEAVKSGPGLPRPVRLERQLDPAVGQEQVRRAELGPHVSPCFGVRGAAQLLPDLVAVRLGERTEPGGAGQPGAELLGHRVDVEHRRRDGPSSRSIAVPLSRCRATRLA